MPLHIKNELNKLNVPVGKMMVKDSLHSNNHISTEHVFCFVQKSSLSLDEYILKGL